MKKIKSIVGVFMLGLCWLNIAFAQISASQNLVQLLSNIRTMQAKFTQVMVRSPGDKQTLKGTVALQRPGKFSWRVTKPQAQLLLADGQTVWFYEPSLKQVTKQSLHDQPVNSPAMLLTGSLANIRKIFNVKYVSTNARAPSFLLTPKTRDGFFQSIILVFKKSELVQMTMVDNLGQKSDYWFSKIKQNRPIAPSVFRFTPPKGVDVIS